MKIKKINLFVNLTVMYWLIQAIIIFDTQGFGNFPKKLSISIFIICLLKWIISNSKCDFFYSVSMIVYSVIYLVGTGLILLFFGRMDFIYLSLALIALLNLGISILTYVFLCKNRTNK